MSRSTPQMSILIINQVEVQIERFEAYQYCENGLLDTTVYEQPRLYGCWYTTKQSITKKAIHYAHCPLGGANIHSCAQLLASFSGFYQLFPMDLFFQTPKTKNFLFAVSAVWNIIRGPHRTAKLKSQTALNCQTGPDCSAVPSGWQGTSSNVSDRGLHAALID